MNLPPLREELVIDEGPRAHDGQPTWTLHDPARNRFFRLDWVTFEILRRWTLRSPETIVRLVQEQTPLKATLEDVEHVILFLSQNQLLHLAGANHSAEFARLQAKSRVAAWRWLVENYLFFRVPLVRPEPLLRWLEARLGFLFRPWFWQLSALAAGVGLGLAWRQWDEFVATWRNVADATGLAGYIAVIVGVKIVHEFGHGLVATHYGCRVPTMGVAFLVLAPVAYTDVNEAWRLKQRRPRLWIGAAGMVAELMLAAWATLAWALLPDGPWRTTAFIVGTTTWVKSLLINVSPVMRFDGYYLLSDALDLPNLHARCFALTRWRLREWLFALREPPLEHFAPGLRRGLVALGVFIWLYRVVVFTGIAIFVYYFFFKALGIVLFVVEILWFVVLPIVSEMKVWFEKRAQIARSPRARRVAFVALLAAVLAFVPFPRRVQMPGELGPANEFRVVAPDSARVLERPWPDGARVAAGQELLRLESPAAHQRLERVRVRTGRIDAEIAAASLDPQLRARLPMLQAARLTADAGQKEAELGIAQLVPRAPFPGVLRYAETDLRVGEWVAKDELLATVVGDGDWQVVAYVRETDRHLVQEGDAAQFFAEGLPGRAVSLRITTVERDATRVLTQPMLAAVHGGEIDARLHEGELVPQQGLYRVRLQVTNRDDAEIFGQVRRGRVVVRAGSESLGARFLRGVASVLWREAGF